MNEWNVEGCCNVEWAFYDLIEMRFTMMSPPNGVFSCYTIHRGLLLNNV